jgi:hypothetical protein
LIFQVFRQLRTSIADQPFKALVKLLIWSLLLLLAFVVLFKFTEGASWEESIWQPWQTFTTVGYGNAPAETTAGRVITMLLSTLGIAFVGALFSAAFDFKQHLRDKHRFGLMDNHHTNAFIVFNFPGNSTFSQLLRELRHEDKQAAIVVVDASLQELPTHYQRDARVHFISGSPLDKAVLEKLNLKQAKALLVFPMHAGNAISDAATKTLVSLLSDFKGPSTRVMHLLVDKENDWMFAGTDSVGISADMEILAMVQECHDPYSAMLIENLLLNTEGANPITFKAGNLGGQSWGSLSEKVLRIQKNEHLQLQLFGLVQEGQPDTCPAHTAAIQADDYIAVIAKEGLNVKQIKSLLANQ